MNDPDPGRIKVTSTITLYSTLNISETLEIESWFQGTTNRKWHMGYQMVTWPRKVKLVILIRLEGSISKTAGDAI